MLNETVNLSVMAGNPKIAYLCASICPAGPSLVDMALLFAVSVVIWESFKWAWKDKRTGRYWWEREKSD